MLQRLLLLENHAGSFEGYRAGAMKISGLCKKDDNEVDNG